LNNKKGCSFHFLFGLFAAISEEETTTTTNIDTRQYVALSCRNVQFLSARLFHSVSFQFLLFALATVCAFLSMCAMQTREKEIYLLRTVAYGRSVGSQRKIGYSKGGGRGAKEGTGSGKTR